jgi:hypothetical protein
MTKGRAALPFGVMVVMRTSQTLFIPPSTCLRQAGLLLMTQGQRTVGLMPRLRRSDHFGSISQPFAGFPVGLGGSGELHAPFFMERRTRGSLQCSVAGDPGPGLASMAILTVSFLPQLAAGKLAARDDTERSGVGTTPLKPKEGLNGAPQIFLRVWAGDDKGKATLPSTLVNIPARVAIPSQRERSCHHRNPPHHPQPKHSS